MHCFHPFPIPPLALHCIAPSAVGYVQVTGGGDTHASRLDPTTEIAFIPPAPGGGCGAYPGLYIFTQVRPPPLPHLAPSAIPPWFTLTLDLLSHTNLCFVAPSSPYLFPSPPRAPHRIPHMHPMQPGRMIRPTLHLATRKVEWLGPLEQVKQQGRRRHSFSLFPLFSLLPLSSHLSLFSLSPLSPLSHSFLSLPPRSSWTSRASPPTCGKKPPTWRPAPA